MAENTSNDPTAPLVAPSGPPDLGAFDDAYAAAPNSAEIPDGIYEACVCDVALGYSKKGDPVLKLDFVVASGPYQDRHIFKNAVITKASLPLVKADLYVLGLQLVRFSDLPRRLGELVNRAVGITKRTKGEYTNVYLKKPIHGSPNAFASSADIPF